MAKEMNHFSTPLSNIFMKLKKNFAKAVWFYIKKVNKKIYLNCWETKKNQHQEYQHLLGV